MTIIDPCDEPVSLVPSTPTDQVYTITQNLYSYQVPAFDSDPIWCDITYSYSVSDPSINAVISFDAATQTFSFFKPDDLSIAGLVSTDYTITVTGVTGNITPV